MARKAHFVSITKQSGLFLFFNTKRQGDFAMDKYIMALIVIAAILAGIAMFYFKDKVKHLKPFVTMGAGLFVMVVNLAALNQAYTLIAGSFIDSGLTSKATTIVSYVGLFVIIAITTAWALKVAFDKAMEEMGKEYPNRKEDKNKNNK